LPDGFGPAANLRLTAEDLREIDEALATIDIKGAPLFAGPQRRD
jgi:hypothetical protein